MYFCVTTPVKISGKAFHTCICYKLTDILKPTVEKLVKEGKATIFTEKKFFCNGKLVEKKTVVKENLTIEKSKKKTKTKTKSVEIADVTDVTDVIDVTDIKDEVEGF